MSQQSIKASKSSTACGLKRHEKLFCSGEDMQSFRCLHSEGPRKEGRAISVPLMDARSFRPRLSLGAAGVENTYSFPRTSPPPSYDQKPAQFKVGGDKRLH